MDDNDEEEEEKEEYIQSLIDEYHKNANSSVKSLLKVVYNINA